MRKVWLNREDFELFHTDITPFDYEFFRTHNGAFKRMWQEQVRVFSRQGNGWYTHTSLFHVPRSSPFLIGESVMHMR